jgi:hypothetical protein
MIQHRWVEWLLELDADKMPVAPFHNCHDWADTAHANRDDVTSGELPNWVAEAAAIFRNI